MGWFIYPIAYIFRGSIDRNPTLWKWLLLYWFTDKYENNFIDRWYGVYEIYNDDYDKFHTLNWFQKFILSYRWLALRNPHWNYQMLFTPKKPIEDEDGYWENEKCIISEGGYGCKTFRNKTKWGKQHFTWGVKPKYFRYSFTKKAKWYNVQRLVVLLFKLKWYKNYNFMAGAGDNRYILKSRVF